MVKLRDGFERPFLNQIIFEQKTLITIADIGIRGESKLQIHLEELVKVRKIFRNTIAYANIFHLIPFCNLLTSSILFRT